MRLLGMIVTVLLGGMLAGCGDDEAGPTGPVAEPFELPVGEPSYDVDAATWAVGKSIRVGEQEIVAEPKPDVYVVTASGIYYLADGTLHFTDGGPAEAVADVDSDALAVSPGGLLALVDQGHGPVDQFGTHVAVPVVFDLATGEQVLRGDPGRSLEDDDLADLYEEIQPRLLGVDDVAVYTVDPLREGDDLDEWRFPLDGGDPEPVDGNPIVQGETGIHGYVEQLPRGRFRWVPVHEDESLELYPAVLSPGEDVVFVDDGGPGRYYDARSGEPTAFSETPFTLGGWVDGDTFYGAFSDQGSPEGPSGRTTIASCDLGPPPICTPLAPELDLPQRPTLVFSTGSVPSS